MKKNKRRMGLILAALILVSFCTVNVYASEVVIDEDEVSTIEDGIESDAVSNGAGTEEVPVGEEWIVEEQDVRTDEVITAMDIDGNVNEVESETGLLEEEITFSARAATAQIVNFNTRGNAVTNYTEYGTGGSGYTNGMYGADAAYLGTVNGKVKFLLSGVIGLVDANLVQVVNLNNAASVSYYSVSNGRLSHYVTTNISKNSYATVLDNGPAPEYLQEGVTYYSYDGHYFYTRNTFGNMIDDYNSNTRNSSVNATNPYYNYFQYLPLRSRTTYSSEQINGIISSKANSSSSKMLGMGASFISCEDTYGVNALLSVGIAANESAWGKSSIAINKNNLFGLNAVDSSPGQSADAYSNPESCIKTFAETYMSKQYLNPNYWTYSGGFLGNKGSGMNVMYASDPYWGEKNANIAWVIDKAYGSNDVNEYTLAIKDVLGTEHTNWNVRKEATTASTALYLTKGYSNQAFIVLEDTLNNGFYKIQSDAALSNGRTSVSGRGEYDFDNMYAYISGASIQIVSKGTGSLSAVTVPDDLLEAITYSTHVQDIGWQEAVNNGFVAGTIGQNLPMEALKIQINGIENLGIRYSAHVQDIGWQDFVADGAVSGTEGKAKKIETLRMELTGEAASNYTLYYRVYVQNFGWLDWACDGELAGTQNYNYSLQAVQIALLPKGTSAPGNTLRPFRINTVRIEYEAHVQDIGWQGAVENGELSGTVGQNKKIEAMAIAIKSTEQLGVSYRGYVQDFGWTEDVSDGNVIGTVGQNKRLEALQINLTGEQASNYDIYYRVHVQDIGWLGWAKNGAPAGTMNYGLKIEGMQIVILPKGNPAIGSIENSYVKKIGIQYATHISEIGWQDYKSNGKTAGTTGRNLQIEAIKIQLDSSEYEGDVEYCSYVEDIGWQDYVSNNEISGTVGQNKQIEAVKIRLTNEMETKYDIYYRVHSSEFGWLGWAYNGASAGSEGYGRQIEAMEIVLVQKGGEAPGTLENSFYKKTEASSVAYQAHVSEIGWQSAQKDGELAGTTGKNLQIEALKISLPSQEYEGDIEYCAHVEDIGWQSYVKNGELAGTVGRNKQIEAVKIRLTGEMKEQYDVYYRLHVSEFGWLGWACNGASAGSEGYNRQVEAIEIVLVKKGGAAPGETQNSFYKK